QFGVPAGEALRWRGDLPVATSDGLRWRRRRIKVQPPGPAGAPGGEAAVSDGGGGPELLGEYVAGEIHEAVSEAFAAVFAAVAPERIAGPGAQLGDGFH